MVENLLNNLQTLVDTLEEEKGNLKSVNSDQREYLRRNFNKACSFEYGTSSDGYFLIIAKEDTYKSMRYYLGLEYEDRYLENSITVEGITLLEYSSESTRIEELFNDLDEILEEEEEEEEDYQETLERIREREMENDEVE